jgi:hypothetical protein
LSVLSGKEITTGKQEVEWIPDVNHLYQVMQVYSNIYKIKPELMMCKAITEILLKVALNTIKQNNNIDQRMNKKHGMPQIHFTD